MTNSELMLAAITNGDESDTTVSAALDVLREQDGWTLLGAVCEVARVSSSGRNARDLAEAVGYVSRDDALGNRLREAIRANAVNLPSDAYATLSVVVGDAAPVAVVNNNDPDQAGARIVSITVGASWVKREASRLMLERERAAKRPRRRRSR